MQDKDTRLRYAVSCFFQPASLCQAEMVFALQKALRNGEESRTYGPLADELDPLRQGGQHLEEVVPQVGRDAHVQVRLDPRHDQRLK